MTPRSFVLVSDRRDAREAVRRAPRGRGAGAIVAAGLCVLLSAQRAGAQSLVAAEPEAPLVVPYPPGQDGREVQVVLQLVVDAQGNVVSAVEASRAPQGAAEAFVSAAVDAVKRARFTPSLRDGRPVRSRIEYVVAFTAPPAAPALAAAEDGSSLAATAAPPRAAAPAASPTPEVTVQGAARPPLRGAAEFRITREHIEASPRALASELLTSAPGFFVDHEDGEGVGNDVHLRGFDLSHGSGIEFRVGAIPLNVPVHIQGQGYADVNFIIPEVVRGVRVLEGVYDPHQGDAAIVGSAYFDLGVAERGVLVKGSYGSFDQWRVVGIAAPRGAEEDTFAAFALRETSGFGSGNRASSSASMIGQYALDLGNGYRGRVQAAAYAARAALAGVVRKDDVDAGRVGFFDSYPTPWAQGQSALASRLQAGVELERQTEGGHFTAAAWAMSTGLATRQNYTGALESSQSNPAWAGRGDLIESTNDEIAVGASAGLRTRAYQPAPPIKLSIEPGATLRGGFSDQTRSLLDPADLSTWDRRVDAKVQTIDAGAYVDVDLELYRFLRVTGGVRVDALYASVRDRLANAAPAGAPQDALPGARRSAFGTAWSPRVSVAAEVTRWLQPVVSYGEGFRSLDANHLRDDATRPFSKVRSVELGLRARSRGGRYTASLAFFQTWVGNELVFEAEDGGLETQGASTRRGVVAAATAKPIAWLFGSASLSLNRAEYATRIAGGRHLVPSVPSALLHADLSARRALAALLGHVVEGRLGLGYTLIAGRYLSDTLVAAPDSILNAGAGLRYRNVELTVDAYNLLDRRYADDESLYVSNWSATPGPHPASFGRHVTAAPPRTILGAAALHF